ncbi:MAG TPA: VCBS repeat-containing protein [Polyangiaceae bacterium]|nr:VCBS repeat-containing protein [Polyangiaceae bacterium]
MKTLFKSAMGLVVWGLCGCGVATDDATSEQAPLGKDTAASTLAGVSQGYRGDFNGDGIEDIIVVTGSGTNEYLGQGNGGFSTSKWSQPSLTLSSVTFTVGDFNKDGRSDIIVTTSGGSSEYTGNPNGGFTATSWVRTDLPLNAVSYHSGDFNGDGATDLLITTAFGTFEYYGVQNGTFRDTGWSAGWPLGSYTFVVGDFNNDTRTDLIVTNASGSYEFLGLIGANGGFSQATWPAGINFLLNQSLFFPGDYNGDGSFDLIAQNSFAAYEFHGISGVSGGFTNPVWTRTDLTPLNAATFIPGDFNGDGKWDTVIATGFGAFLYLGRSGNQGITGDVWHDSSLVSYTTGFYAGNFAGTNTTQQKITDLIVITTSGSNEYRGIAGTTTGGFSTNWWIQPQLALGQVGYF